VEEFAVRAGNHHLVNDLAGGSSALRKLFLSRRGKVWEVGDLRDKGSSHELLKELEKREGGRHLLLFPRLAKEHLDPKKRTSRRRP